MLDPSSQLQSELRGSIEGAVTKRRPILSHINADTTWVLSLPYPDDTDCPPRRCRFNILIDPWLHGPQTDVASWFSTQWHKIRSSVQTIRELNDLLRDREDHELPAVDRSRSGNSEHSVASINASSNYIDAIVCSHEFTDHCHRQTLEEVDPSTPCFATSKAAELIRSWEHFKQVIDVPPFGKDSDWRRTSASPLPSWIGIARLVTESDALYFHSAVAIFCRSTTSEHSDEAEVVIYTPHGIHADDVGSIPTANPPVRTLALMHGLHDVYIKFTKQLNLGAQNALRCQAILKSKYWVATHDEVKVGGGIIGPFLRRKAYTLKDALETQKKREGAGDTSTVEPNYFELGSGQTLLLD